MIYFNIPWSTEKNIGKAYNDFMELLPSDNDFACFLDGDAMFLHPFFGLHLENIIKENPDCGIFTATTNRIACRWQRAGDWNSNDIAMHRHFAQERYDEFGNKCEQIEKSSTGMLMGGVLIMIRKSTWRKLGGFKLGILGVDNELQVSAEEHNEPLLLMKGVYVYHWYRGGKLNDTKHLQTTEEFPRSDTVKALSSRRNRSRAGAPRSKGLMARMGRSRVARPVLKHTEIINEFIKKNSYKSYLEIGVQFKPNNFDQILAERKVGVDPDPLTNADFIGTSNAFFDQNKESFDIIFIDGLHEAQQVIQDINNSVRFLRKGGMILVHDCLPTSEGMQAVPRIERVWTGDVWKALVYWKRFNNFSMKIIDVDTGIAIIQFGHQMPVVIDNPTWAQFDANKNKWFDIQKYEKDNLFRDNR